MYGTAMSPTCTSFPSGDIPIHQDHSSDSPLILPAFPPGMNDLGERKKTTNFHRGRKEKDI